MQTLKFLHLREEKIEKEIILMCQDQVDPIREYHNKLICLGSHHYFKSQGINIAVDNARGDIIVILDSDRILPFDYFYNASRALQRKMCISTRMIANCTRDVTDDEVRTNQVPHWVEYRHDDPAYLGKTVWSGNTMLFREDYLKADEKYWGYGFLDNDLSMQAMKSGYKFLFTNDYELHLYHERNENILKEDTLRNATYFSKKWQIVPQKIK